MKVIRISCLFLLLVSNMTVAAGFDCNRASSDIDKIICSIKTLNQLDRGMSSYYFKLRESLSAGVSEVLLNNLRIWLRQRTEECGAKKVECLINLYKDKMLELRKEYRSLVPYTYSQSNVFQGIKGDCSFDKNTISDDTLIYAGGSYGGKKIDYHIDQSEHQATQFEVIVNSPEKPVALILGAYEPSIWNIAWTQGTKISAVLATGYHRQAVAGLPKDTPILISSYDNGGPCGHMYVTEENLIKINPLSNKAFNKQVDFAHYASKGKLVFGDPISHSDKLYTSKDTPPDTFFDKSIPLAGQAGLDDLVRKGLIRRATMHDSERWGKLKYEMLKGELPPVALGSSLLSLKPKYIHNGYVILAQITIPSGLYGAHSATFFLDKGVPYPKGKLGHSALYDFNSMSCFGAVCQM